MDFNWVHTLPEKSEAEKIADRTEKLLEKLSKESCALLTVGELIWISTVSAKPRIGTSAHQEQVLYDAVLNLVASVGVRKSAKEAHELF